MECSISGTACVLVAVYAAASMTIGPCAGQTAGHTQAASEPAPYKYVGNNFSFKFHRPSCPFARAMSVRHVELFHFRRDAIAAGQKPCRYCLPPDWKTVRLEMLAADPEQAGKEPDGSRTQAAAELNASAAGGRNPAGTIGDGRP